MFSYDQTRKSSNNNLEMILTDCKRENAILKDEQNRLNNQLRNIYSSNQKLMRENQTLLEENQELNDLSLYLDDERIRLSKMIEEWEKCGRYYCDKFSSDISTCKEEITRLEMMETSIAKENSDFKDMLTSMTGITEALRRGGGDGSSSTSPFMEADVRNKVPGNTSSSVFLSPPFSDSDESLGKNNPDFKSLSIYRVMKHNPSDISIEKPYLKNISDEATRNTTMIQSNNPEPRIETSELSNGPTTTTRPYYDRSSSLGRSTMDRKVTPLAGTKYIHPFQRISSTEQQQHEMPRMRNATMTTGTTSSSSLATDCQRPGTLTYEYYIPNVIAPSRLSSSSSLPSSVYNQQYNQQYKHLQRPASSIPSGFQSHMIGFQQVADEWTTMEKKQPVVKRNIDKEYQAPRIESTSGNKPFNYKTSF